MTEFTSETTEPEFHGSYDFVASVDEEGNPCVREYGTPYMYTPGDRAGHQYDFERDERLAAPRYECDALVAAHAREAWLAEAREACVHFGIAEDQA